MSPLAETGRVKTPFRALLPALASASAWVGAVATAIFVYEPLVSGRRFFNFFELIGFTSAFACSGTIALVATTGLLNSWRRALATALFSLLLLPLTVLELDRVVVPAVRFMRRTRVDLLEIARTGAKFGVPAGLAWAAVAVVLALITIRRKAWRVRLTLAAIALMVVAIPLAASSIWNGVVGDDRYYPGQQETLGAVVGSVVGLIWGVFIAMVASYWPRPRVAKPSEPS